MACNDWLRLGRGRSLRLLIENYTKNDQESPPTRSLGTLKNWSAHFEWGIRADEYDAEIERQKNERRQQVMESGLALDFERTDELKQLARFLLGQVYEHGEDGIFHNVWLPDVKQIGSGEFAERIDIVRFNAAIIGELRGVLDDLAKETGGRVGKHELTGRDGGPIEFNLDEWKRKRQKQLDDIGEMEEPECGTTDP